MSTDELVNEYENKYIKETRATLKWARVRVAFATICFVTMMIVAMFIFTNSHSGNRGEMLVLTCADVAIMGIVLCGTPLLHIIMKTHYKQAEELKDTITHLKELK